MISFMEKLRAGLARSTAGLGSSLGGIFTKKKLDADTVAALEEALIRADMGVGPAKRLAGLVAKNRYDAEISEGELRAILAAEIASDLSRIEKPLLPENAPKPFVVLVAGVNGTGKTTTSAKLAHLFQQQGEPVFLIDANPTAENIAKLIFDFARSQKLPVLEVSLWETFKSYATYRE